MKLRKYVVAAVAALMMLGTSLTVYAAEGWQQDGQGWKYEKANGTLANNEWIDWNGNRYFIDFKGYMKQDTWVAISGEVYYLGSDGAMLRNTVTPDGSIVKADGTLDSSISNIYNIDFRVGDGTYEALVNQMNNICALLEEHGASKENIQLYNIIREFVEEQIDRDDSDYEKVVKITEFIWSVGSYNPDGNQSSSAYELLVLGEGMCGAYARSFQMLASASGLECFQVLGVANGDLHEWNKVRVDGEWYNADVTESLSGNDAKWAPYILSTDEHYGGRAYAPEEGYPDCIAIKWNRTHLLERDGYL